jgi:hypothetical protein
MIKIMKAMKQLLIVIALLSCNTMLMATEYQLHQTSKATYKSISSGGVNRIENNYDAGYSSGIYRYVVGSVCPVSASPIVNFHSTSAMLGSGSTLPNAASSGFISADDNLPSSSPRGPRRVIDEDDKDEEKPESWEDPFKDTLTDAVPCLLILALGYALYLRRKKSVTTLDCQNKQ